MKRVFDHSSYSKLITYTISKYCTRFYTFVVNFIFNFTKLIFRSLILRSLTCVLFYLVFGINTAYAWVDYNGVEHDDTVDRIEILPIQNTNLFRIYNRLTGQSYTSEEDFSRYSEYERVASYSNNQEEFEANWKEFRNRQGLDIPPNIPTEDPSNNPTVIPVQEEGKSNNADAKRNNPGNMTLTVTRPPFDSNLANMLSGSNSDANIDRNTILPEDSVTQINDNSTQALERRLKELHGGSSANSYTNNRRDVSQILNTPQPVFNNSNVYSPGTVPPLPTHVHLPTFNHSAPLVQSDPLNVPQVANPRPIGGNPPVVPPSPSWYSSYTNSMSEKLSNLTSIVGYLTGQPSLNSNIRSSVEIITPSKTSVLTSVAISAIGIGVHFLVNTYTGTKTGTFIRNVPGMIKREDMVDWYLDNPMSLMNNPWDKLKYIWNQPVEMNSVLDHFNGDYWSFAAPGIKAIAPLVFPALDHSILAGFPIIGGIAQATGMSPSRVVSIGAIAATQALATATGTTFSGAVSNIFARLTAVNMSVFSAIGSSISWAWSKISVGAVKQAAAVLKGSGNMLVNGLQAAGVISAQTAAQINNFRNSTNKKIQDWLLGSGGSALFGKLFGSEGSKLHSRFEKLLKKLDGDFPWLELLILITMGLYSLRILWIFRKRILRLVFRRFLL